MPIPPRYGVARVCQRSARGADTKRRAAGDRITSQSTTTVTGYEMRNAVALTVRRLNVGY